MQPVEPSTIVRGPAAFTISFMTRADSQPWHVRCPEVKYSSRVTFLIPRNGSRTWVALPNVVSAMAVVSYSRTPSQCVLASALPDFAAAEAADEAQQRGALVGVVERGADLVGYHARMEW